MSRQDPPHPEVPFPAAPGQAPGAPADPGGHAGTAGQADAAGRAGTAGYADPGGPVTAYPSRPDYTVTTPPVPAPAPQPPRPVRASFALWLASFAAGLVAVSYSMGKLDELRASLGDEVRDRRPGIAPDLLDQVVDTTVTLGLGAIAGIIAVQLLLSVLMRYRLRGARVSLALMGVFGTLITAFSLVAVAEQVHLLLLGQAVLVLVAIVMMFLPSAAPWFRHHSA